EGGRHTPFFNNYRPQFYFRTTDVTGAVELPKGTEMVMPGDNVKMVVTLITPIAMEQGLRFAIREGGKTVGAGGVAKIIEEILSGERAAQGHSSIGRASVSKTEGWGFEALCPCQSIKMTTENTTSIADKIKLGLALILVGAGIWAYYWLTDAALVLRLLAVVGGLLAGAAVAWLSAPGEQFLTVALEAWLEV